MGKATTSAMQGIASSPMRNSLYDVHTVARLSVRALTSVSEEVIQMKKRKALLVIPDWVLRANTFGERAECNEFEFIASNSKQKSKNKRGRRQMYQLA